MERLILMHNLNGELEAVKPSAVIRIEPSFGMKNEPYSNIRMVDVSNLVVPGFVTDTTRKLNEELINDQL